MKTLEETQQQLLDNPVEWILERNKEFGDNLLDLREWYDRKQVDLFENRFNVFESAFELLNDEQKAAFKKAWPPAGEG